MWPIYLKHVIKFLIEWEFQAKTSFLVTWRKLFYAKEKFHSELFTL